MYKIMLVDDERNIRNGIKHLIDWDGLDCEVVSDCRNGKEALYYIEDNEVDIIVTDIKMPVIDGLELCKNIKENKYDVEVIILTAYSDFTFAQKAIKYNVVDFVIKNEFIEELPSAVEKAKEIINEKRKESKKIQLSINDYNEYRLHILTRLALSQNVSIEDIEKYNIDKYNYCISACEINYYDEEKENNSSIKMIKNFLNITMKDYDSEVVPIKDNHIMIVILIDKNKEVTLNKIVQHFNEILLMVEEFMRLDIKLGISQIINETSEINNAYKKANEALSRITTKGNTLYIYDSEPMIDENVVNINIEQFTKEICDITLKGDKENAEIKIKDLGEELVKSNKSFEQCKMDILIICSSIIRNVVKYDISQDFNQIEKKLYKSINDAKTMFSLIDISKHIVDIAISICTDKKDIRNKLVTNVDNFIKINYKNNISLQDISNALFLNSSYLSRAYKKSTGITVTDAINMYRITKAKSLLKNSELKIYEIGLEVGFSDPAYFSHVFVKYNNQNPTEYRNSNM
ncbi:response regulator transcription factor [Vallitalea guaymasensis]|uniref:response regulator transcription factor n=1 Tax=Vallitalea guaymasensis TaxID=1185412 RepID=UPI000DE2EAEB|nr:response regulator [Vallitalea guaymasensis]